MPTLAFRVISDEPSPQFLGRRASERNTRVVEKLGRLSAAQDAEHETIPALRIPAGVVITPALVAALPPPDGIWHLSWHASRPPIVWRGPALSAVEGPALSAVEGPALSAVEGPSFASQVARRVPSFF